ncbi:unnamed protein product [Blepharisma stoltei]|uniref:Uncharacterized protein n=1 Tax=Blepharisma stoltei TaxID=1481888 RepID=A0AAU9IEM7_9CILI|nr:unnamed protein product [Blepharisma stoltei]
MASSYIICQNDLCQIKKPMKSKKKLKTKNSKPRVKNKYRYKWWEMHLWWSRNKYCPSKWKYKEPGYNPLLYHDTAYQLYDKIQIQIINHKTFEEQVEAKKLSLKQSKMLIIKSSKGKEERLVLNSFHNNCVKDAIARALQIV